jgi:polypeptide N-acetylgalactosaminyltransferase
VFQDLDNPALRLKESVIEVERKKIQQETGTHGAKKEDSDQLQWQYFDERAYIDQTKVLPGQDAYAKNKFNQAASDRLRSNREIPDTRHPR